MSNAALAKSLLQTAERLAGLGQKRPTQANLRRSVSTSYYAAYHALAQMCADCLVGTRKARRPNRAWTEVYRGLAHGPSKEACNRAANVDFPQEIKDFADAFIQLQEARHTADYDPLGRYTREQAQFYVELSKNCIEILKACEAVHRKAFATWVLITSPGAVAARKVARERGGRD